MAPLHVVERNCKGPERAAGRVCSLKRDMTRRWTKSKLTGSLQVELEILRRVQD